MFGRKQHLVLFLLAMGAIRHCEATERSDKTKLGKQPLYLMHIYSPLGFMDLASMVDFTLELINTRSNILQDYELKSVGRFVSSQGTGQAMKAFIDMVSVPPTKIAIIGPTFTDQAKVVADVASYYNLLEMAYTVTSPLLSNTALYPYFGRTAHNSALHNPAIIQVLKHYNWRKVAKLVHDYEYIVSAAVDFQALLDSDRFNFTTLATSTYSSDPSSQLQQIKESGAKIMIFFSSGSILCKLYQLGLYGARYQTIVWSGEHGVSELRDDDDGWGREPSECSQAQIWEAAEGMLYFNPIKGGGENKENPLGINSTDFSKSYSEWALQNNRTMDPSHYIYVKVVDAVIAMALALNNSLESLPLNYSLDQFNYGDAELATKLFNQLTQVRFNGLLEEVAFDHRGDRSSKVVITQFQGGVGVPVATFDPVSQNLTWSDEYNIKFIGGRPPTDSDIYLLTHIQIDPKIYSGVCVLASLGLVYCVICLGFNIKYGQTRLVKLSSPRINSLIAFGCALSYVAVILMGTDSVTSIIEGSVLCNVRVWMMVFGFTFAFGSLFSKTWRVHVLFTNKKLTRKVVKDYHLFAIVLGVAAVDALYLTIWTAVDPLHLITIELQDEFDPIQDGVVIQPRVDICSSAYTLYWTGPLYGFKALLLIFGIFFAWETRKVEIEALNDSKQVGICVYNVTVMSVIAVPMINLLSVQQVNISFGVAAIAVLLCSTMTLLLVYGQKMFLVATTGSKVNDVSSVLPFAASLRDKTTLAGPSASGTRPTEGSNVPERTSGAPSMSTAAVEQVN